jgi:hypothetical protein
VKFGRGNGFMRDLIIYDASSDSSSSSLTLRKNKSFSFIRNKIALSRGHGSVSANRQVPKPALKEPTTALHVSLPSLAVNLSGMEDEKLMFARIQGVRGEALSSGSRLEFGFDVSSLSVKNCMESAKYETILERLPGDDVREPLFAIRSTIRVPHSTLNPSDLMFFEDWHVTVRPLALRLVSFSLLRFDSICGEFLCITLEPTAD